MRDIFPLDGTLTFATSQNQSGPGSNGNEGLLHNLFIPRTGAPSIDAV